MHLCRDFISNAHVRSAIVVKMYISADYVSGMVNVIEMFLTVDALRFNPNRSLEMILPSFLMTAIRKTELYMVNL